LVRALIPHHLAGSYTLFDATGAVYAGRSDTDLRRRLITHARANRADYFDFDAHTGPAGAFLTECATYHAIGTGLQNTIHPAMPRGAADSCPFCHHTALDTIAARLAPDASSKELRRWRPIPV
jgi:hypothetical protein